MVALNTAYASENPALGPKNRVGNFFGRMGDGVGSDRPATRNRIGEKRPTLTIIASGRPYWPSRDPVAEDGGLNLYGFNYNAPTIYIDVLGQNPLVVLAAKELSKSLVFEAAKQASVGYLTDLVNGASVLNHMRLFCQTNPNQWQKISLLNGGKSFEQRMNGKVPAMVAKAFTSAAIGRFVKTNSTAQPAANSITLRWTRTLDRLQ